MGNTCFHRNLCYCFETKSIARIVPEKGRERGREREKEPSKEAPIVNYSSFEDLYTHYKESLKTLQKNDVEGHIILLTSKFWKHKKYIEEKMAIYVGNMKDIDSHYSGMLDKRISTLKKLYEKLLQELYILDRLIIPAELEEDDEARAFFGIRKRTIRFSSKPTIHIIPRTDSL